MDSDLYNYHQQQQSSGLTRYRSAPSSFFPILVDDNGVGDFLNHPSPSNESETMFANFVSFDGSGNSESREVNQRNAQFFSTSMKQEAEDPLMQQNQSSTAAYSQLMYETPLSSAAAAVSHSTTVENPMQTRPSGGNLIRQHSSPAGFFSGFAVTKNERNVAVAPGMNGKNSSSTSGLYNYTSFSSGPSSGSMFVPQFAENGNTSTQTDMPGNGGLNGNGKYQSSNNTLVNDSCNDSTYARLNISTDGNMKMFSSNGLETQNGYSRNCTTGLTHHVSLPKTSAEMAAVEKYLQFQQYSVPCKIRAKRGCATHPRSIAERVRRTRISERMRKLLELFPNIDKQTSTADMLDLVVEHIKNLQKQVDELMETRAKCTCSSTHQ